MYQVLHHQFVASAQVVKLGHEINPEFQIGCMIAMVPLYPYSCHPDDVMYAQEAMRERFLFSDVHVVAPIRAISAGVAAQGLPDSHGAR